MECVIVEPVSRGWAVRTGVCENLMLFRAGGAAERAAHRVAFALATAGEPVELEMRLRDGSAAARYICLPPAGRDHHPLFVRLPGLARTRPRPVEDTAAVA